MISELPPRDPRGRFRRENGSSHKDQPLQEANEERFGATGGQRISSPITINDMSGPDTPLRSFELARQPQPGEGSHPRAIESTETDNLAIDDADPDPYLENLDGIWTYEMPDGFAMSGIHEISETIPPRLMETPNLETSIWDNQQVDTIAGQVFLPGSALKEVFANQRNLGILHEVSFQEFLDIQDEFSDFYKRASVIAQVHQ